MSEDRVEGWRIPRSVLKQTASPNIGVVNLSASTHDYDSVFTTADMAKLALYLLDQLGWEEVQ